MTENNWILTDVDCMQHIRDTGNGAFECIQIQEIVPEEEYAVVMDRIELLDYSVEDILAAIKLYGYDSFDILIRMYGKDTPRVVAECLFESISCFQREKYRAIGPYEYCRFWIHGFLYEWEERHGCLKND